MAVLTIQYTPQVPASRPTRVLVSPPDQPALLIGGAAVWKNNTVIAVRQDDQLELTCAVLFHHEVGPPSSSPTWTAATPDGSPILLPPAQSRTGSSADEVLDFFATSISGFRVERWRQVTASPSTSDLLPQLTCHNHQQSVTVLLNVEFQPEFTISRTPGFGVPIVEGQSIRLKCSVESNPPTSPFWEHNGSRLRWSDDSVDGMVADSTDNASSAELLFESIRQESEGWYQCSAEHKFGNFSSVGYYLAVKSRPGLVAAMETAGGLSRAEQTAGWTGSGREASQRTTSSQLAEQVLLVKTTGHQHGGMAANTADCGGGGQGEDNFAVEGSLAGSEGRLLPTVTPDRKTMSSVVGETALLVMELCSAGPPAERVLWSGPHQLLLAAGQDGPRAHAKPIREAEAAGCLVSELVVQPVSSADAGLYLLLVVTSDEQVAVGCITLTVTGGAPDASGATRLANVSRGFGSLPMLLFFMLFLSYIGRQY